MTPLFRRLLLMMLLLPAAVPATAWAETLVLIHGYLGDGDWRAAGATRPLLEAGWADGGQLALRGDGAVAGNLPQPGGAKRFYTLALPSEAPLLHQLGFVERYVQEIRRRHGRESLYLAGHSAGGVLGRLYMVKHPEAGVDALITVASPHLGSEVAELGNAFGQTPLAWAAPLLGLGTLNRSQGLYYDLNRSRPGNLLYWLNGQPHPEARYVSIVRESGIPLLSGDGVAPAWSQDLNGVWALRDRALTLPSSGDHALRVEDGVVIARLLGGV